MTNWHIVYRGPDGNNLRANLDVEGSKSARDVKDAIENGEVGDLFIKVGAIVSVEKAE